MPLDPQTRAVLVQKELTLIPHHFLNRSARAAVGVDDAVRIRIAERDSDHDIHDRLFKHRGAPCINDFCSRGPKPQNIIPVGAVCSRINGNFQ